MANEFRNFLEFVEKTTGRFPEKLANSFQDVYIYVPIGKTPPKTRGSSSSLRTVFLDKYFSNLNKDFSQLLYNEDWNILINYSGSDLLRFCFKDCIFAKRTKTGGFMISSFVNLRTQILTEPPQKLDTIFYHTAICFKEEPKKSNDDSSTILNNTELRNELWRRLNYLFSPIELEISTDEVLFKLCKTGKFPDDHVLVKKNTGLTVSSQVMTTKVGLLQIVKYEDCVNELEPILKQLKKLHSRYDYERALDQLITVNRKYCNDQNMEKQLPLSALKIFFAKICRYVIPRELFGNNKNTNAVIKLICDVLEAPRGQSTSLMPYIAKMQISSMRWLDEVKDIDNQLSILAKLLKWFFTQFIMELFRTQLYVMVTNSSEKIYFKRKDRRQLTTEFMRKMCKDKVVANTTGCDYTKVFCIGRWMLLPKRTGMRPIMSRIKDDKPGEVTKLALCYLQQLYVTKYGRSDKDVFLEKWRNLVNKFRSGKNKTMYLVCCDIEYAYGSIDQNKLVKIVKSLAELTGPVLELQSYIIARNLRAVRSNYLRSRKCVVYPDLEPPIAPNSIFASACDKVTKISKELLLKDIILNVRYQNLLVSGQKYLLQKGIPQGAILSAVLCDMYYAHMEEANLSHFKEEGFLYRYVDDILFATENEALAKRFLMYVNRGFPEYNCRFNPAKTRTNLPGHEHTTKDMTYLGFNINPQTLEVSPDYSKSPRHTTMLSKPKYKVMETFHKRLSNLASLKLDGLVLDCKINSEDTVICNVKRIFMRQAERCLWLLKALFDDLPKQLNKIFSLIKSTNLKIIRRIQRYYLANGYDFDKLDPQLAVIPWKSYREVFATMRDVYIHFRCLFVRSIRKGEILAAGY